MFDGRGKESVTLNGVVYENPEQSIEVKSNHDLHKALVDPYNKNFYWPSTVFLNEKYEKLRVTLACKNLLSSQGFYKI